ncbi:MAG TPA: hypothetical protein EYP53_01090 [Candidatus Latescibacteria bacterium]|nr:hypothetical protein [Candidatus Latescibacterota bacterium]
MPLKRSHEYASVIIEAAETNEPAVIYGSVPNKGLIDFEIGELLNPQKSGVSWRALLRLWL